MNHYIKVLVMGVLLGTSFPVSKLAIGELGVWPFRLISSASALLGLLLVFRKELLAFFSAKVELRPLGILALLAIPNIFLVPTLNNVALSLTSASNALILVYIMPPMLSVIKMAAERKVKAESVAAAVLALAGIHLLLSSKQIGLGEMVILLSATVWAFGTYFAGRAIVNFPASVTTTVQFFTSFVLVAICAMLAPAGTKAALHVQHWDTLLWPVALAVYVGFVANAIVFHLWFSLIKERGAEFVAYSSLISLMVGALSSILLFRETVTFTLLASLTLMVASVYIVQCLGKRPASAPILRATATPAKNES